MTEQQRAKMQEIRNAQYAEFARQCVEIDDDWVIQRVDSRNWQIQFKGSNEGNYYSSLPSALAALPAKMLDEVAAGSLAAVLASHKAIVAKIDDSLSRKTVQNAKEGQ